MDTLLEQNEFTKAIWPGPVLPSAVEVHEWHPPVSHGVHPAWSPVWADPRAKLGKPTVPK